MRPREKYQMLLEVGEGRGVLTASKGKCLILPMKKYIHI
jgi:hypothetical protein